MGSSEGKIALEIVSADISRIAPPKKQAGIRMRLSGPRSRRRKWGTISPTNPMIPDTDTQIAVISEAQTSNIFLVFPVSIPSDAAVLAPSAMMFRSRLK